MSIFNRIIKYILYPIVAVMVLTTCMAVSSVDTYAAGTHSVVVKFNPEGFTLDETTYRLYKVGKFGENGTFAFIEPYDGDIKEVPNYKEDDPEWSEKWMDSAKTVSDYIKNNGIEPVASKTAGDAESREGVRFTGLENGFYLVTGTSTRVNNGGKVTYYWPRPMYIRILNDEPVYELKPMQGTAGVLRVCKQWAGDDKVKKKTRPDSIRLRVSYDGERREDIVLPHNGKWYYEWETEMGEDDPEKWAVTEVQSGRIKKYYIVQDSDKFVQESDLFIKTITNTYEEPDEPGEPDGPDEPDEPEPDEPGGPDEPDEPGRPPSRVRTGDYSNIVSYIAVFAAAVVLLVFAIVARRKRK